MAWNSALKLGGVLDPDGERNSSAGLIRKPASSAHAGLHEAAPSGSPFAFGQREGESDSEYCYRRNSSVYGADYGSAFIPRRLSSVQHSYPSSVDHSSFSSPAFSSPPSSTFSTFPLPSPGPVPRSPHVFPPNELATQRPMTNATVFDQNVFTSNDPSAWFSEMQNSFLLHRAATTPIPQSPPRPLSANPQTSPDQRSSSSQYPTASASSPGAGGANFERSASMNSLLVSPLRRASIACSVSPPGLRERKSSRLRIAVPGFDMGVAMTAPHTAPMIFGHVPDFSSFDPLSTNALASQFPLPPSTTVHHSAIALHQAFDGSSQVDFGPIASSSNSIPYQSRLHSANPSPRHSRHTSYSPSSTFQPLPLPLPLAPVHEDFSGWVPQVDGQGLNGQGFDSRDYPASAPAWQTTFQLAPQYFNYQLSSNYTNPDFIPNGSQQYQQQYADPSRRASIAYYHQSHALDNNSDSQLAPPSSPSRPRSAPAIQAGMQQGDRRRGSSVDPTGLLWAHSSTPPHQHPSSPIAHNSAPPSITIQQRSSFSPSVAYPSPAVSYPSPPVIAAALPSSTSPKKRKASTAPKPPRTPKPPKGKKGAGGMAMFINFTSEDSAKLIAGVAPSGSSKRKRLEEEAEALERERAGSPSKERRISREFDS